MQYGHVLSIKFIFSLFLCFIDLSMNTVSQKKTGHQTLGHNFTNYYPIFKIFSLANSVVNLQQIHV